MNTLNYKIVVIGKSSVGKSAILSRLISDTFSSIYMSTIGIDFMWKETPSGKSINFFDIGGTNIFSFLKKPFLIDTDLFLIITDRFNQISSMELEKIMQKIHQECNKPPQFLIIRNKTDKYPIEHWESILLSKTCQKSEIPFIPYSAKNAEDPEILLSLFDHLLDQSMEIMEPNPLTTTVWDFVN